MLPPPPRPFVGRGEALAEMAGAAAAEDLEQALEVLRQLEDEWHVADGLRVLARARCEQGDRDAALGHAEEAVALFPRTEDRFKHAEALDVLADVRRRCRLRSAAREAAREASAVRRALRAEDGGEQR